MRVSVVTPDASFFDGEATFVVLQAIDGEVGILPKHAPLIARLGHGVARIDPVGGSRQSIAVYGGFVKVQDDMVTVLAGGAATPDQATAAEALEAVNAARTRLEQLKAQGAEGAVDLPEAQEELARAQVLHKLVSA